MPQHKDGELALADHQLHLILGCNAAIVDALACDEVEKSMAKWIESAAIKQSKWRYRPRTTRQNGDSRADIMQAQDGHGERWTGANAETASASSGFCAEMDVM